MDRLAKRRQAAVLDAIAAAFPAPPIPPEEVALRAELNRRMAEVKAADPDPFGATAAERLAVDPDWLHHTPEGRRVYRRRAQWLGKMRRQREAVREELQRQRVEAVAVPVVHSAQRSTDRRPSCGSRSPDSALLVARVPRPTRRSRT